MSLITDYREVISEYGYFRYIMYNIGDIEYLEERVNRTGLLICMECFFNSEKIFEFNNTVQSNFSLSCSVSGIDI